MLPWSVIPRAGWPSCAAAATTSPMRAAPSSIEYSVWTWRCVKLSATAPASSPSSTGRPQVHPQAVDELHGCHLTVAEPWRPASDGAPASSARPRGRGTPRGTYRGGPGLGAGRSAGRHRRADLASHLLELLAGRHLLREQRGLDPVEEALEPPDQLRLGDAQLGPGGCGVGLEGQGQASQLLAGGQGRATMTARRSTCRRSRAAARGSVRRAPSGAPPPGAA